MHLWLAGLTIVTHCCLDLPAAILCHSQRVQNMTACIVSRTGRCDHITLVLRDLQCLPVRQRIDFKILTLAFRTLHGEAPEYIEELAVPYVFPRQLRSADEGLLRVPAGTLETCGRRHFAFAAATLWNGLSVDVRRPTSLAEFQRLLKTHASVGWRVLFRFFFGGGASWSLWTQLQNVNFIVTELKTNVLHAGKTKEMLVGLWRRSDQPALAC